ncbi:MAG: protein FxsA [Thermoleophilaceae bacterium]|jgi:UPF0716 protein FxsA|nr:protein FxsA [Thermoleophilaceae bacterium]
MVLPVLFVVFIVVPLAELYVIIQVGQQIGIGWTILLLAADSVIGSLLLKSQGRAAWRRFNEATEAGRVPAREVADGALIMLGGAFLISPGFITDIIGVLLLLPPTRAGLRRFVVGFFTRRTLIGFLGRRGTEAYNRSRPSGPRAAPPPPARPAAPGDEYVEGSATEYDEGPSRRLDP